MHTVSDTMLHANKKEIWNIPKINGIVVSLTFLVQPLSVEDVSEDLYMISHTEIHILS